MILMNRNDSGIIYCLSKKDAETVANELFEWSGRTIKVGTFFTIDHPMSG